MNFSDFWKLSITKLTQPKTNYDIIRFLITIDKRVEPLKEYVQVGNQYSQQIKELLATVSGGDLVTVEV